MMELRTTDLMHRTASCENKKTPNTLLGWSEEMWSLGIERRQLGSCGWRISGLKVDELEILGEGHPYSSQA